MAFIHLAIKHIVTNAREIVKSRDVGRTSARLFLNFTKALLPGN